MNQSEGRPIYGHNNKKPARIAARRALGSVCILCVAMLVSFGCDTEGDYMQTLDSPCAPGEPYSENEDACPPCESDQDCVVQSDPCSSTGLCLSNEVSFEYSEGMCSESEGYDVPPDSSCICVEASCVAAEQE